MIADPINLHDCLATNDNCEPIPAGYAIAQWLAEHLPAVFLGVFVGMLAVVVPSLIVAEFVR